MNTPFIVLDLAEMRRKGVTDFQNSSWYQMELNRLHRQEMLQKAEQVAAEQRRRFDEQIEIFNRRRAVWDIDC